VAATAADTVRVSAVSDIAEVCAHAPAGVVDPGYVSLPRRDVQRVLTALDAGPIEIVSSDDGGAEIRASGGKYTLGAAPVRLALDGPPCMSAVSLEVGDLARMLECTYRAVGDAGGQRGMLFEFFPAGIRTVATDGRRLCLAALEAACDRDAEILVPLEGVSLLRKLASCYRAKVHSRKSVSLEVTRDDLYCAVGTTYVRVRSSAERFPPYRSVLPLTRTLRVRVSRLGLISALRALDRDATGVFEIASCSLSVGGHTLPADVYGAYLRFGAYPRLLLDALTPLGTADVDLRLSGALDPIDVRPVADSPGWDVRAIVMPARL
jgi:DNA polymerase III sliding clamp (beta) subunit (PCNA family)